jgi:4-amino-4-deoxy-L-arabinose transferase-like glycosyltransferase
MNYVNIAYGLSNKRVLILILAIGLLLRLSVLMLFWDTPLTIVDETHYQAIAENILNHGEFSLKAGHPSSIRPPLYPAFLSACYALFGKIDSNGVRIIQIFFSLGIIYVVFLLGKRVFNDKTGLAAGLIFACYPSFVFFSNFLLTEILFTLLFALFVCFFLELFHNQNREVESGNTNKLKAFLSGVLLGLSALTRSILYPFLPVALVMIVFLSKGTPWQKIKYAVLLAAGYAVIISPWAIRNSILHQTPVVIGTMGGLNLYMGNYEHTPLNRAWAAIDLTGKKIWYYGHEDVLKGMNEAQKQKWAVSMAKDYMGAHKLQTLKRSLIKAANFWGLERAVLGPMLNGHWPKLKGNVILVVSAIFIFLVYGIVVLGSVFGLIYNFGSRPIAVLITLVLFAYFTGMHALVFGHSRYHLPLVPLLAVFASWSMLHLRTILEQRKEWQFKLSLIFSFIFIAIWFREIVFIEGTRLLKGIAQ